MPSLQLHMAFGLEAGDKPLPSLPPAPASPTLTNPDLVLPDAILPSMVASSPHRLNRPPSPSYLRSGSESPHTPSNAHAMARKDKMGLMSRKMMLMRGRTNSGQTSVQSPNSPGVMFASSPTLQDVGNLAPESSESDHLQPPSTRRRPTSGSGSSSSDLSALNGFLAKYTERINNADEDDGEAAEHASVVAPTISNYEEGNDEADIKRRIQEQEEYESAILSKRAEQILANAKKRLNVMEDNLRGARDLVAPLTAANLKRAASLGSGHYIAPTYNRRMDNWTMAMQETGSQPSLRHRLPVQTSSPSLNREYASHARGYSETEIPERSHSAMDNQQPAPRLMRMPVRVDPSWAQGLRGSRSFEVLGQSGGGPHESSSLYRGSPELGQLEPLHEDDEPRKSFAEHHSYARSVDARTVESGSVYSRPSSRTSDLREQMSNLKGRIAGLKERAREESMRRQSSTNLRDSSPFNNALAPAPEFFYTPSPSPDPKPAELASGVANASTVDSPDGPTTPRSTAKVFTGEILSSPSKQPQNLPLPDADAEETSFFTAHMPERHSASFPFASDVDPLVPIGMAITGDDDKRMSVHQRHSSVQAGAVSIAISAAEADNAPVDVVADAIDESDPNVEETDIEDDAMSDTDGSLYEDAVDQPMVVVPHEERNDAFDYQQFFLNSAMARYDLVRRDSDSDGSVSSTETARGPRQPDQVQDDEDDDDDDEFDEVEEVDEMAESEQVVQPAPRTPERLRAIERELHRRVFSSESMSSASSSYATAVEGRHSPDFDEEPDLSVPPPTLPAAAIKSARRLSRPGTAIKRSNPPPPALIRHDSGSERADSGVGLSSHRATHSDGNITVSSTPTVVGGPPRTPPANVTTYATSATSPRPATPRDPITVAVNSLLNPTGSPLGLKDKVMLFEVMESLRSVVHGMQVEPASLPPSSSTTLRDSTDPRASLRAKLEDVKKLLSSR